MKSGHLYVLFKKLYWLNLTGIAVSSCLADILCNMHTYGTVPLICTSPPA